MAYRFTVVAGVRGLGRGRIVARRRESRARPRQRGGAVRLREVGRLGASLGEGARACVRSATGGRHHARARVRGGGLADTGRLVRYSLS